MNYLETLKNITKDKKKRRENLLFILIILIVLLFTMNYIFKDNTLKKADVIEEETSTQSSNDTNIELETKIKSIINQIEGVEDASVLISYKDTGQKSFVYNTQETFSEEGNIESIQKDVAQTNKEALIDKTLLPQVEGVIIVAKGINSKAQDIKSAIGALLGISSYKVQLFEK